MSARLRVLHVVDSLCRGGAESMLAAILHELAGRPQVSSVVRAGRIEEADPQLTASIARDAEQLAFLRSEHVYDPRFAAGLVRAIRRHSIDVVHSHLVVASVNARVAARTLGRPHLTSIHTLPGSTLTDTRAWLLADRLTAPLSQLFVAPSAPVAEACARHYRLDRERFRVIPNAPAAAPVAGVDRAAVRAELFGPDSCRALVLCVARLVPGKGIDDLIDAASALGEVVGGLGFAVAGSGPEEARLREAITRRGLEDRVRLLGQRDDVARLLAAADVFCLPSHHEAAPISLLEAMSAGCPCVATAVGAIPEMLEAGRCGLLTAPGDPAAIAAALERVLTDPALARSLAERSLDAVRRHYRIDVVTDRYVDLYRELAAG